MIESFGSVTYDAINYKFIFMFGYIDITRSGESLFCTLILLYKVMLLYVQYICIYIERNHNPPAKSRCSLLTIAMIAMIRQWHLWNQPAHPLTCILPVVSFQPTVANPLLFLRI